MLANDRAAALAATVVALFVAVGLGGGLGGGVGNASTDQGTAGSDGPIVETVIITRPTPFSDDCGDPEMTGTGTPGHEGESHLAVDPRDPDHLVATWQQDRYNSVGGARSTLVAASFDGGRSWTDPAALKKLSACTGGERHRASDPHVAIGADGTAYQFAMPVSEDKLMQGPLEKQLSDLLGGGASNADGDVAATVSRDGGASWTQESVVFARDDGVHWNEWPTGAAHPSDPNQAFVVWLQGIVPDPIGYPSHEGVDFWVGFARTEDAGASWSPARPLPSNVVSRLEWPIAIFAVPDGPSVQLVVIYVTSANWFTAAAVPELPWEIYSTRSDDLGNTWTEPQHVGSRMKPHSAFGGQFPSAAVGPDGSLYVAWSEAGGNGSLVRLSVSTDRGDSWSLHTVADVAHETYHGEVGVSGDGRVGVWWYDLARDVPDDAELTADVVLAATTEPASGPWKTTVLAGPFDLEAARLPPYQVGSYPDRPQGIFVGHYHGMAGLANGFGATFTVAGELAADGPTDIMYARVTFAAAVDACPGNGRPAEPPGRAASDCAPGKDRPE